MRLRQVLTMLTLVCAVTATAGMASAATLGTQFDLNSGTLVGDNGNTYGWRFGLTEDISVTQLGALNGVTSGGAAGAAHNVRLYDEATQALVASAVVYNGAAGSTTQQWSWTTLGTPVTLNAGSIYRIATSATGDKWTFNTANHSVGPEILIGTALAPGVDSSVDPGSRVAAYGAGVDVYPGDTSIWTIENIYDGLFGANFQYETLTVDPPLPTTTLFSDDIENAVPGQMPSTPSVGSWEIVGNPGYSIVTNYMAPAGGNYFAATLRDATWNSMNAMFTEQTNPTDVVRLEADVYGNSGLQHISLYNNDGDYVAYVMFSPDGKVIIPGGETGQTWDIDEWNHFAIEYSPGASTFDLYIDNQPKASVPVHEGGPGINQIRFAAVTSTNWTCVDNVLVTVTSVPEPTTMALLACGLMGLMACGRRRR